MSGAPSPAAKADSDLIAAFELLRQTPAGDVPGQSYHDALVVATRRLHAKTRPYRLRPATDR